MIGVFRRLFARRQRFARHSVRDLVTGAAQIDLREFEARRDVDKRAPSDVCELRRPACPTPCWWPYCNCGER